jgi:hypothetical protein
LTRIAEIDRNGPTLRSVIEVNPDALIIAAELIPNVGERDLEERCMVCRCW